MTLLVSVLARVMARLLARLMARFAKLNDNTVTKVKDNIPFH